MKNCSDMVSLFIYQRRKVIETNFAAAHEQQQWNFVAVKTTKRAESFEKHLFLAEEEQSQQETRNKDEKLV